MVTNALTFFYVPWMVLYYTWVFLVMGKHIKEKGFKTLYDRCVNKWPFAYFLAKADQYHPQLFRSGKCPPSSLPLPPSPSATSRGGSLRPSSHADVRSPDDAIALQQASTWCESLCT